MRFHLSKIFQMSLAMLCNLILYVEHSSWLLGERKTQSFLNPGHVFWNDKIC